MLQINLSKESLFENISIILVFGCLVQPIIAAPHWNLNPDTLKTQKINASDSFFKEDIPFAIKTCEDLISHLQDIELHQEAPATHRLKRDIEDGTPLTTANVVLTVADIVNEIKALQKDIARLNETSSLSAENKSNIMALNDRLNKLQKLIVEKYENLENLIKENDKKIQDSIKVLHLVMLNNIVRNIQSLQFSFADEQLQYTNDYKYVVNKVYNRRSQNFELLISFGKSIEDSQRRFNVFEALYNEMKENGHKNIWLLNKLSESLRSIIDPLTNATLADSQSLRRSLWNENQDEAIAIISLAFVNESFSVGVRNLSAEINNACLQCVGNIYKKVIENVLDEVGPTNVLNRASKLLVCIDECIFIHEAIFDKLIINGALYNHNALSLAYYMKLTMENTEYQNASLEMKSRHENIKTKLPKSAQNIIFSSAICLKNSANNEYLFTSGPEGAFENGTHSVYTCIPPGVRDIPAQFKWRVQFDDEKELARLINVGNGEFLYTSANALYGSERRMVYTWKPPINSTVDLTFEVDGDGLNIRNKYEGEFLFADSAIKQNNARYVFTYIPKSAPLQSRWEAEDCVDFN